MNEKLAWSLFGNSEADKVIADRKAKTGGGGTKGKTMSSEEADEILGSPEAQPVLAERADRQRRIKFPDLDWTQLLMSGGGGLLGHTIASSLFDDSEEEKRKRSVWHKLLATLLPLGVGGLGAYGGYMLGDALKKTAADGTDFSEKVDSALRARKRRDYYKEYGPSRVGYDNPEAAENAARTLGDAATGQYWRAGISGGASIPTFLWGISNWKKWNAAREALHGFNNEKELLGPTIARAVQEHQRLESLATSMRAAANRYQVDAAEAISNASTANQAWRNAQDVAAKASGGKKGIIRQVDPSIIQKANDTAAAAAKSRKVLEVLEAKAEEARANADAAKAAIPRQPQPGSELTGLPGITTKGGTTRINPWTRAKAIGGTGAGLALGGYGLYSGIKGWQYGNEAKAIRDSMEAAERAIAEAPDPVVANGQSNTTQSAQ